MGFFSAIGGAISSAWSSASSFVSSACSTISSVCSSIGSSFFSGAGGIAAIATGLVGSVVGLSIPQVVLAVVAVCKIVSAVAELLGVKDKEEQPEELGMKAEEAGKEGIKPEDFDSTEAYIDYLRKEVQIDKEKLENLSDEDKIKYGTIGSALYIKGMEEKYDIKMSPEFWTTVARMDLKGEEVKAYIDKFKENGMTDMKDMANYIERKPLEEGKSRKEMTGLMMETLRELNPDLSEDALADKLFAMGKKE